MKIINKTKDIFLQLASKHPGKLILLIFISIILVSFFLTTTVYFGYKNGKLEFEVKKRELNIDKVIKRGK